MKSLSKVVVNMPRSGIRQIASMAVEMPDCIRLDLGEPHFPTPRHICDAAHKAALDGFTKYTTPVGLKSLREAMSAKLKRVNGLDVPIDRIVATCGATSGLFNACLAILEHGDEMLLPDPGWPNWEMMVLAAGGRPVRYAAPASNGFLPDPAALDALVTPRTKGILINSPSNPTGAVMPADLLRQMVEFARRHDLWVVSDECYDEFVFSGEHTSAARYDEDGRVISVFSCSKTYAMTGWRVGYVAVPAVAAEVQAKLQEPVIGSICAVAQKAAEAALNGPQENVGMMRDYFRARRDQAIHLLEKAGIRTWRPEGAFFLMVDISGATLDTYGFAKDLLLKEKVSVAPGETFGPAGRGLVRIALATSEEKLETGLSRLIRTIQRETELARMGGARVWP
jgi:aspartate aminotransferase